MKHLDEGTIHAWLDGELSAVEARDAETHVASCAECSANVAEARGFIAGASRILTALDDVPAVAPKRAPSTAPAVRQWRAAPWVTGIAATLMLAIGIKTFTRTGAPETFGEKAATASDSIAPNVAAAPSAPATPTVRIRNEARPARPTQDAAASERPAQARADSREPALGRTVATASGAGGAAAAPLMLKDSVIVTAADAQRKVAAELPAPSAALTPVPESRPLGAGFAPRTLSELAGCYRVPQIPAPSPSGAEQLAAKAAGVAARAAAERDRRRASVAAAQAPAADVAILQPPPMIRLDSARMSSGAIVRSINDGAVIGTWVIVGDSVRANLLSTGPVMVSTANRTACPQPPE